MLTARQREMVLQVVRHVPSAPDDAFRLCLEQVRRHESESVVYDGILSDANYLFDRRVDFESLDEVYSQWSFTRDYLKNSSELHAERCAPLVSWTMGAYSDKGWTGSDYSDSDRISSGSGMDSDGNTTSSEVGVNVGIEDDSETWSSTDTHATMMSEELVEHYVYGVPRRRDSLPYANSAQADFTTEVQDCWDQHCDRRFNHLQQIEEWAWAKGPEMSPIALSLDIDPAVSMEHMHILKSRLALRERIPLADEGPVPIYCRCARNQCRSRRDREEFERLSCDCLPPPLGECVETE